MVDTFVKLIEKLTELAKYRKDLKDKSFDVLITQVFKDIKIIHTDYLKIFETCRIELSKNAELTEIAGKFMKDRIENEALRRNIIQSVEVFFKNEKLKKYTQFFWSVTSYFSRAEIHGRDTRSSMFLMDLERCIKAEKTEDFLKTKVDYLRVENREMLLRIISGHLSDLREGWENVSKEYAELISQKSSA